MRDILSIKHNILVYFWIMTFSCNLYLSPCDVPKFSFYGQKLGRGK